MSMQPYKCHSTLYEPIWFPILFYQNKKKNSLVSMSDVEHSFLGSVDVDYVTRNE